MADGDVIRGGGGIHDSRSIVDYLAIDAKAAVGDGVWINTRGFPIKCVEVEGITVATVIITESHRPTAPLNTFHGFPVNTLTADGLTTWESCARWVKIRISAYTSGTITAWLGISS